MSTKYTLIGGPYCGKTWHWKAGVDVVYTETCPDRVCFYADAKGSPKAKYMRRPGSFDNDLHFVGIELEGVMLSEDNA